MLVFVLSHLMDHMRCTDFEMSDPYHLQPDNSH